MPTPIKCPSCGRTFQVKEDLLGKLVSCVCHHKFEATQFAPNAKLPTPAVPPKRKPLPQAAPLKSPPPRPRQPATSSVATESAQPTVIAHDPQTSTKFSKLAKAYRIVLPLVVTVLALVGVLHLVFAARAEHAWWWLAIYGVAWVVYGSMMGTSLFRGSGRPHPVASVLLLVAVLLSFVTAASEAVHTFLMSGSVSRDFLLFPLMPLALVAQIPVFNMAILEFSLKRYRGNGPSGDKLGTSVGDVDSATANPQTAKWVAIGAVGFVALTGIVVGIVFIASSNKSRPTVVAKSPGLKQPIANSPDPQPAPKPNIDVDNSQDGENGPSDRDDVGGNPPNGDVTNAESQVQRAYQLTDLAAGMPIASFEELLADQGFDVPRAGLISNGNTVEGDISFQTSERQCRHASADLVAELSTWNYRYHRENRTDEGHGIQLPDNPAGQEMMRALTAAINEELKEPFEELLASPSPTRPLQRSVGGFKLLRAEDGTLRLNSSSAKQSSAESRTNDTAPTNSASGDQPPEITQAIESLAATGDEIVGLLRTIQDVKSAELAAPTLERKFQSMVALALLFRSSSLTADQLKELETKFKPQFESIVTRIGVEIARIQALPDWPQIEPTMTAVLSKLQ